MVSKSDRERETEQKGIDIEREHKQIAGGEIKMAGATTVQKWGNSLAVRIPKDVADEIHIEQGSLMELRLGEGTLTLVPKKQRKKYTLDELLSGITTENKHREIDLGTEGNELI